MTLTLFVESAFPLLAQGVGGVQSLLLLAHGVDQEVVARLLLSQLHLQVLCLQQGGQAAGDSAVSGGSVVWWTSQHLIY